MTHKKINLRKNFSAQFKEQALVRVKKDGISKAAKDLSISESALYGWRKKLEQTGVPFEDQMIQSAELTRMKREIARLTDENAFLKKAAAYFAKEPK